MSQLIQLELLEAKGSLVDIGNAQGEHLRERIHSFIAMRFDAVDKYMVERGRNGMKDIFDIGRRSMEIYRQWHPEGFEEHQAIAKAANVATDKLFTAANMTDMRDAVLLHGDKHTRSLLEAEGCTSALVPPEYSAQPGPIVGQTWDLNPPDLEYVIALHRKPDQGPSTWTITCTGCLTLMGMSERGLAVGTTNIKTFGSQAGVGYLCILHRAIQQDSAEEASSLVQQAPHAGAHTYWIADETLQLEWEASPRHQFRRDAIDEPISRSNHCLFEPHIKDQGEEPNESSYARLKTMQSLLGRGSISVDRFKEIFADRSQGVHSINRYPEDEQGTATNAVFIALPKDRVAYACRGPADRGEWVRLDF